MDRHVRHLFDLQGQNGRRRDGCARRGPLRRFHAGGSAPRVGSGRPRADSARLGSLPHLPPLLPSRVLRDLRLPHQWEGAPRLHDERCTPSERNKLTSNPSGRRRGSGISRSTFRPFPGAAARLELPPRERVESRLRATRRDCEAHSVRELHRVRNLPFPPAPSGRGSWARPPSRFLTVSSPKSPKKGELLGHAAAGTGSRELR